MADGLPAGIVHAHGEGVPLDGVPPVADIIVKICCHRGSPSFRQGPVGLHRAFRGGRCTYHYAVKVEGGVLEEFQDIAPDTPHLRGVMAEGEVNVAAPTGEVHITGGVCRSLPLKHTGEVTLPRVHEGGE